MRQNERYAHTRTNIPEVILDALKSPTAEIKNTLTKDITEAVTKHFNVPAETVMVQIAESSRASKFRGCVPLPTDSGGPRGRQMAGTPGNVTRLGEYNGCCPHLIIRGRS